MDLMAAILNATSNPGFNFNSGPGQGSGLLITLGFVSIFIVIRLYRGINGRYYRTATVLRGPVVYVILTLLFVVLLGLIDDLILLTLLFIPAGTFLGYRFGTRTKFFTRGGSVFYSRSPVMMSIWFGSYIVRLVLEVLYPTNLNVMMLVDSALSLTTGLLIGEALNIIKKRKEYVPSASSEQDPNDRFIINQ